MRLPRFLRPDRKRSLEAREPLAPPSPRDEFFTLWSHFGKQRFQMFSITLVSLAISLTLLVSFVRPGAHFLMAESPEFVVGTINWELCSD